MATRHRFMPDTDETEPLFGTNEMQEQYVKPWNKFQDPPRENLSGSSVETKYLDLGVKIMKIVTIVVVFLVVIASAVVSKATTLFMTSQLRKDITRPYCNKGIDRNYQFMVSIPDEERVTWFWMLYFAYCVPEFGTFVRSVRKCFFKNWTMPSMTEFLALFITEACPAIGSGILVFLIFPELDVIRGAMLTNAVCFVPGVVALFSRDPCAINDNLRMTLDIISVVAQATSFVVWPLLDGKPILYMIPVSVILISVGWWENFVSDKSKIPFIRNIGRTKKEFKIKTYFLYAFIAPIKCVLFLLTGLLIFYLNENNVQFLFDNFYDAFTDHTFNVTEITPIIGSDYSDAIASGFYQPITTWYMTPIWVFIINFFCTYICYAFGKFSCRVMIQGVSFAFPINLSVPVLISGLIAMCGSFIKDECAFREVIPEYLFFTTPPLYFLEDFVSHQHAWVWLIWLLSQAWITVHIWSPNCDKLASTEQLFMKPMYDAFLVDQGMAMTRRRHESPRFLEPVKKELEDLDPNEINEDKITRIYACGTMWHETREEMIEFLKSILRLDQDQCAHRIVRNYLQFNLDSYYELETHIFFDDAFIRTHEKDTDPHVNEFVELLVSTVDEAASKVHGTDVRVRPPHIYSTPYGGRLVWTLPGKTKMIAHLKDKKMIRAKKRWSQVMYMYYLLGYKLMCNEELSDSSKDVRALNTYILALDGDIDFKPEALHLLVDYMKKNRVLGAACGRIHPIGSGAMAWYQIFEYAIGHWMQKATEHVIGCVLCSPGCFSLFRGSALMDKSVMKKYTTRPTEAKHYVQYDQGEDRWLCTLLLQRGHRVEYSAASDAYTHCPEGFNEFYNQRRRWMPSTIANIIDLLTDYKQTVEINDNISFLYVIYQGVLLGGTIIGPGTIFLMLVGAFVVAFGLDQWNSLLYNLIPILIFVIVCATCSSDIQLLFAAIISAIYGLIMMAVFVGVLLQVSQDGWLAPSSLFLFIVAASFVIAAILHPKEFYCLKYGIIYYVTVPSMYMLLVIYSVFNMNNVSWGTREVTVVPKDQNKKEDKKEDAKKKTQDKVFRFLGSSPDDNQGVIEFSLNKLFKVMCCTYRDDNEENEQLKKIQESIKDLAKKIDLVEKSHFPETVERRTTSINTTFIEGSKGTRTSMQDQDFMETISEKDSEDDSLSAPSEDVMQNSWFYDGGLIRGEVRYLNKKEEVFFTELIEEYLEPIEDDKAKVSAQLKDLRDKMVFTFFMLNCLYVLVVFLLTLEKENLHINWPISPKVNFTYDIDRDEIMLYKEYLELEPTGFVFLIFFATILIVQFVAMVIHRFATFSQILTNTNLEFSMCEPDIDEMTNEEIKNKDPLKIAKDLQKLKGINDENEELPEEPVDRRKTQSNLINRNDRRSVAPIFDLDKAFHARVQAVSQDPQSDPNLDRRKSVAFVTGRRTTLFKRASESPQKRNTIIMQEPGPLISDC